MHARLDISWRGKQCVLAKGPKIIAKLHMSQVSSAILNLAPIVTNVGAQDNFDKIPTRYQAIIDKYPNLTQFNFKKELPAHNVVHHIGTHDEQPCRA